MMDFDISVQNQNLYNLALELIYKTCSVCAVGAVGGAQSVKWILDLIDTFKKHSIT